MNSKQLSVGWKWNQADISSVHKHRFCLLEANARHLLQPLLHSECECIYSALLFVCFLVTAI